MNEPNPYNAPHATLDLPHESAPYQPSFIRFKGRIGRLRYLAYSFGAQIILAAVAVPVLLAMMGGLISGGDSIITVIVLLLILGIPYIVITITFGKRRLNDLNHSGWWSILLLVPIIQIPNIQIPSIIYWVSFPVLIYVIFFPGTKGPNKFGPIPADNTLGVKILALGPPALFIIVMILAAITGNLQVVSETQ